MNFFKREYECKNVICKFVHRLIFNNIYKLVFFASLLAIGAILPFDWSYYIWVVGAVGLSIMTLIFMIYAWIINPINSLKERRK